MNFPVHACRTVQNALQLHLLLLQGKNEATSLTLHLNIEQYENMIGPNFAAGINILLYDENDIPVFKGQGQGIGGGWHTFAGVSVKVVGLCFKHSHIVIRTESIPKG